MTYKNVIFFLLVLSLIGCAYNPIEEAPQSFSAESKTALIAGTISIIAGKPTYHEYNFYYSQMGKERPDYGIITIEPDQRGWTLTLEPDYFIGDTMVFQFIFENNPGTYAFTNYTLENETIDFEFVERERRPFSIPFELVQGEITYVGDIVLNTKEHKEIGKLIRWTDNSERELAKFRQRFPGIDWNTFQNRTLKQGKFDDHTFIEFIQ